MSYPLCLKNLAILFVPKIFEPNPGKIKMASRSVFEIEEDSINILPWAKFDWFKQNIKQKRNDKSLIMKPN